MVRRPVAERHRNSPNVLTFQNPSLGPVSISAIYARAALKKIRARCVIALHLMASDHFAVALVQKKRLVCIQHKNLIFGKFHLNPLVRLPV